MVASLSPPASARTSRGRGATILAASAAAFGALVGLGSYTFVYARGGSYLTDDPAACANCHVMREQYEAWQRSPHRAVAVCNDCHAPQGTFEKYFVKARNGFNHSLAFTTMRFPEPIRMGPANVAVTEAACRRCHESMVSMIDRHSGDRGDERISCIRCHPSVGHLHAR